MSEQVSVKTSKTAGTWAWFFQRLSAVLLIVFLGLHIFVAHFMNVSEEHAGETLITFGDVSMRLGQFLYIFIDYTLLALVLFHGLNGARTVMFDFDMFMKRKRAVDVGLWVLGIATLVWGIVILWPFMRGT